MRRPLAQVKGLLVEVGENDAPLQHVVNVLDHDPLDVVKLGVDVGQVPGSSPAPRVSVRLLGLLNVGGCKIFQTRLNNSPLLFYTNLIFKDISKDTFKDILKTIYKDVFKDISKDIFKDNF